jgi:hypothetical protein
MIKKLGLFPLTENASAQKEIENRRTFRSNVLFIM